MAVRQRAKTGGDGDLSLSFCMPLILLTVATMNLLPVRLALALVVWASAVCGLPWASAAAPQAVAPLPAAAPGGPAQPTPQAPQGPASTPALTPALAPALADASAVATGPHWEGAIGLLAYQRPEYQGADRRVFKLTLGVFIRYGRLSITNASGFRTRNEGEVSRGASLDLLSSRRVRLSAALRVDRGRTEDSSGAFRGLGDVPATLRVHANLNWQLIGNLSLGANWNVDALGRGGGNAGSLGLSWDLPLGPRSSVTWYGGVLLAGDRYMQTYYGVTPEQAALSGYPVYTPRAGARANELSVNYRTDLSPDWLLIASASATHLVGPAAASPLTHRCDGWEVRSGVARRF